jgi:hypothetical protein
MSTRALCCTWTCLSTRTFAAPVRVCLQELCDAPERVCLQESSPLCNCRCSVVIFFIVSASSKQVRLFRLFRNMFETPKQTENFFGFLKQTEKQTKEIEFRFFSVSGRVCLQEPLLHLCVSVSKSFVTHLGVSAYKSLAHSVTLGARL